LAVNALALADIYLYSICSETGHLGPWQNGFGLDIQMEAQQ
jgi:hypothetical protein